MIVGTLLALAFAAVPGAPGTPQPGPQPNLWVDLQDDNLLVGGPDDNRTGALSAGASIDDWALGFDYAVLTDRRGGCRSDEGTVTLGHTWTSGPCWSAVGVGVRLAEDLGGGNIQNDWHRRDGDDPVVLSYDRSRWAPLVYGQGRWELGSDAFPFDLDAAVAVSTRFVDAELEARCGFSNYDVRGRRACLWIGGLLALRAGGQLTPTAASAYREAAGPGLEVGTQLSCLTMRVTALPHRAYGQVGFQF